MLSFPYGKSNIAFRLRLAVTRPRKSGPRARPSRAPDPSAAARSSPPERRGRPCRSSKIGQKGRPQCEAVAPEVRKRKQEAVIDAGDEPYILPGLLQQELRDLGPRPVERLPVVRARRTEPLLRQLTRRSEASAAPSPRSSPARREVGILHFMFRNAFTCLCSWQYCLSV